MHCQDAGSGSEWEASDSEASESEAESESDVESEEEEEEDLKGKGKGPSKAKGSKDSAGDKRRAGFFFQKSTFVGVALCATRQILSSGDHAILWPMAEIIIMVPVQAMQLVNLVGVCLGPIWLVFV